MTKREILDRMNEVARKPPGDDPVKLDLLMLLQLIKDLATDVRAEETPRHPGPPCPSGYWPLDLIIPEGYHVVIIRDKPSKHA